MTNEHKAELFGCSSQKVRSRRWLLWNYQKPHWFKLPRFSTGNYREETVRIPGRPVHFTCTSHCIGNEEVTWFKDTVALDFSSTLPDGKLKFIKSAGNGLVIWNVTTADEGVYTCASGRFQFAEYGLRLPGSCRENFLQLKADASPWSPVGGFSLPHCQMGETSPLLRCLRVWTPDVMLNVYKRELCDISRWKRGNRIPVWSIDIHKWSSSLSGTKSPRKKFCVITLKILSLGP